MCPARDRSGRRMAEPARRTTTGVRGKCRRPQASEGDQAREERVVTGGDRCAIHAGRMPRVQASQRPKAQGPEGRRCNFAFTWETGFSERETLPSTAKGGSPGRFHAPNTAIVICLHWFTGASVRLLPVNDCRVAGSSSRYTLSYAPSPTLHHPRQGSSSPSDYPLHP